MYVCVFLANTCTVHIHMGNNIIVDPPKWVPVHCYLARYMHDRLSWAYVCWQVKSALNQPAHFAELTATSAVASRVLTQV